jgi:coenzyme F420 hydrogenase subunit beta
VQAADCGSCRQCLDVCPVVYADYRTEVHCPDSFVKKWGQVVGIWEGHACDSAIRFTGASGGALTAIAAYCIERLGMYGVLHIAQDPEDPIRNRTRLSRSRYELLEATGSRYSPASVCDGLGLVEAAPSPCVVIGKPAEIAALRNARKLRCMLDRKVGVTLSFFCAESPSTRGTIELLEKLAISPASLSALRYRGHGWPGCFVPIKHGESSPSQMISYRESWGFLQAYRPWSVQLWPDGTGELADISCGDPWYQQPGGNNPGSSMVLARTARGREIVEGAIAAGYLDLKPAQNWKLEKSQSNLLDKKGAVWGRRFVARLFGLPVGRLPGVALWHCWLQLRISAKLRSLVGTACRIVARRLYQRMKLAANKGVPSKGPRPGQFERALSESKCG